MTTVRCFYATSGDVAACLVVCIGLYLKSAWVSVICFECPNIRWDPPGRCFKEIIFFPYPTPVKMMSPIFFLAVQYNFKNFQLLSRLMTLSMASVRLWYHWMCSRSISSASSHSGWWSDSPPRCAAWIDDKGRKSSYTRRKIAMQFNWNHDKKLIPWNKVVLWETENCLPCY